VSTGRYGAMAWSSVKIDHATHGTEHDGPDQSALLELLDVMRSADGGDLMTTVLSRCLDAISGLRTVPFGRSCISGLRR
jgi:hypothetical protein